MDPFTMGHMFCFSALLSFPQSPRCQQFTYSQCSPTTIPPAVYLQCHVPPLAACTVLHRTDPKSLWQLNATIRRSLARTWALRPLRLYFVHTFITMCSVRWWEPGWPPRAPYNGSYVHGAASCILMLSTAPTSWASHLFQPLCICCMLCIDERGARFTDSVRHDWPCFTLKFELAVYLLSDNIGDGRHLFPKSFVVCGFFFWGGRGGRSKHTWKGHVGILKAFLGMHSTYCLPLDVWFLTRIFWFSICWLCFRLSTKS